MAGFGLGALWTALAGWLWGSQAAFAAGVFGGLALLIQAVSLALMGWLPPGAGFDRFIARWGVGMGLRFLGVVALAVAGGLDRAHFPAVPMALGFLGVLVPLLFYEVRLIR